ncbi:MAG: hypothetical protein EGQ20_16815 [Bacteroides oleiciplenus]|nr:hypothetical protein [Bacteroides oleiciplenus]
MEKEDILIGKILEEITVRVSRELNLDTVGVINITGSTNTVDKLYDKSTLFYKEGVDRIYAILMQELKTGKMPE